MGGPGGASTGLAAGHAPTIVAAKRSLRRGLDLTEDAAIAVDALTARALAQRH